MWYTVVTAFHKIMLPYLVHRVTARTLNTACCWYTISTTCSAFILSLSSAAFKVLLTSFSFTKKM